MKAFGRYSPKDKAENFEFQIKKIYREKKRNQEPYTKMIVLHEGVTGVLFRWTEHVEGSEGHFQKWDTVEFKMNAKNDEVIGILHGNHEKVEKTKQKIMANARRNDNVEEQFAWLMDQAKNLSCDKCKDLIKEVLKDVGVSNFKWAPAAGSTHQNYIGGLVEHVCGVLKNALAIAENYKDHIDINVLVTATILHDACKVTEYFVNDNGNAQRNARMNAFDGHLVRSYAKAIKYGEEIFADEPVKLEQICHAMLSHHGRKEWGSPVEPATPEAWILHLSDMADSRIAKFVESLRGKPTTIEGTFKEASMARTTYWVNDKKQNTE